MKIITACIVGALVGTITSAALADPMSEAKFQGGYNKAEDRFLPAELNFVGKNLVSPGGTEGLSYGDTVMVTDHDTLVVINDDLFVSKTAYDKLLKRVEKLEADHKKIPANHGCVSLIEGVTLENRQNQLEQRIKDVETEVFGGAPKRYGF